MATTITEVQGNNVKHCIAIDLTLDNTTYYISSAWKPFVHDGNNYTELGAFLNISSLTEDIKTTNGDITISLSGIPSNQDYLSEVLNSPIKGGEVVVYRAFFDDNYVPTSVYQRFKGIITNFAIDESENILNGELSTTIGVTCASINSILENKVSGQRTAPVDRNKYFAGDQTFYRVPELQNIQFDFGREYTYQGGGPGRGGGPGFPGILPPGFNPFSGIHL